MSSQLAAGLDPAAIQAPPDTAWCAAWTARVDQALRANLAAARPHGAAGVAVVAVGGYGRGDLCPASDIDVLLLYDGGEPHGLDELVRALCYPLWDAGLEVGHAVVTPKEVVRTAQAHTDRATSLLTRRLVAGDRGLVDELDGRLQRWLRRHRGKLMEALDTDASRGPAGWLEPDLKRDPGGLRSLQRLRWAAACLLGHGSLDALVGARFLGAGERKDLVEAEAVLLAARCALHRVEARPGDRLRVDLHADVAAELGLADGDELLARTGLAMRLVTHAHERAWPRLRWDASQGRRRRRPAPRELDDGVWLVDGQIELAGNRDPVAEPSLGLRAIAAAASANARLGRGAAERLRRTLTGQRLAWDRRARQALLAVLGAGPAAPRALAEADHVGVLAALLPDWPRVRGRPQRNPFHLYDLDTHLAETVAWVGRLAEGELDCDHAARWRGLEDPEALLLGAWLHDVGKAWDGDHSAVGADIAGDWVRYMGFGERRAERVATLVGHHLLLADAATRRDIDDPEVIAELAGALGDTEALDALLLLSLADSRATGPSACSPWKDALLGSAYLRVRARLHDDAVTPGSPEETAVAARGASANGASFAEPLLAGLPRRYLVAASPRQVLAHADLLARRGEEPLACDWHDGDVAGTAVMSVVADDRVGLLADCAGALTGCDLDLLDARAVTRADGLAVDWFTVTDAGPRARQEAAQALRAAAHGHGDVAELVAARERRRDARLPREAALVEHEAVVDDDRGEQVRVEITAPSAPGLVFRLARAAADAGWSASGLKATSLGAQARVVFFLAGADDAAGGELAALLQREAVPPRHLRSSA
jgi:[protein-PII] uridylyltransferase